MEGERIDLFFAVFEGEQTGADVAHEIQVSAKRHHVTVDGLASVYRDRHGRVHLHEIGDITGSQGAVRGALVGAAVGLLFPPALLASSVLGGALGSMVAKVHDTGFGTTELHTVGEGLDRGQSAVMFVGELNLADAFDDELSQALSVEQRELPPEVASGAKETPSP
jgi:uncharacterized membrane protein